MLKNTDNKYGVVARTFHWLSALAIIGLFAVGIWMVDLDYYSEWYTKAPHYHKSIGILLFLLTITRIFWKVRTPQPKPEPSISTFVYRSSQLAHWSLYLLILFIALTGYLISTADNRAIEVFNWFSVPSLGELFQEQEDVAGEIHEIAAYVLIALSAFHAIIALKHHFVDKDTTLKRML